MATEPTPTIAERLAALDLTQQALVDHLGLNALVAQRIVVEGMVGKTRDRVLAALDDWEKNGVPQPGAPRWQEQMGETREQQLARAAAEGAARQAAAAARREEDLAKNEAARLRYIAEQEARVVVGQEMTKLREGAGMSLAEVAIVGGVKADFLDRMERAKPTRAGELPLKAVIGIYYLAARLSVGDVKTAKVIA